ncbi:DUF2809 domain-containing protein [Agromyces italicus]|uniref:DUF2809 domain-containing protein n=1 Tax=Agromyces italicus TaxID=279572 RepID=UPI0003B5A4F0|nr:DUF2809 domain-containing protein [Agromyces italicus]
MTRLAGDRRLRLTFAATAVLVLLMGLALQLPDRTVAVDLAGSALYACLAGLAIAIAWPRLPGWAVATAGFGVAGAVELLQLARLPARLVDAVPLLRFVFGSSFDPLDFVGYILGALLLIGIVSLARSPVTRGRRRGAPAP